MTSEGLSYAAAGVDVEAYERALERVKPLITATHGKEVAAGVGPFAGLYALPGGGHLAASADGVGTKIKVAIAAGMHRGIGADIVNHCVNDIACLGARPLFFLDYFATGKLDPEVFTQLITGMTDACRDAGCALLGGETAEHPGVMRPDEYDISGTGVGVVEEDAILGRDRVQVGDVVIAMRSSGLHSNGYSLVRHVLLGAGRMRLDSMIEEFGKQRTLGEELLTPTKIYAKDCLNLMKESEVHAFAHVTGGGIPGNLVRVLPDHVDAVVDRSTWRPQPIFELVRTKGRIEDTEMEATFNMGIGMLCVVTAEDGDRTLAFLAGRGIEAWQVGEVIEGTGTVQMVGSHTRG